MPYLVDIHSAGTLLKRLQPGRLRTIYLYRHVMEDAG